MKRILLLNDKQFPKAFTSISDLPPLEMEKEKYVEDRMIESLNQYNPKLMVTGVEYLEIEKQFPKFKKGKSNGVLIEEFEINPSLEGVYRSNGCYIFFEEERCVCRRILMYIFISDVDEESRTGFISQTIFPTLLDYAGDYIQSPSYSIANHKFCFLNILNKKLTARMILRHLAGLCAAGMDYVDVFENDSLQKSEIPADLKSFLQMYTSDYNEKYDEAAACYENDNYRIEFDKKLFRWKIELLEAKLVVKEKGQLDFNGSSEKFYWMELLPMTIFAYNQGYRIDYSCYQKFIENYRSRFSKTSKKFARCEILLQYIEKYCI